MIGLLVAVPAAARADSSSVTVTLTPEGQQLATSFGDSEAALIQKVQTKIDDIYQTARIPQLLDAFVGTTEVSNRSLGVDYATRPGELMIGAVADGALASDAAFTTGGHVTTGAVINFAVMTGANLARWDHPRWTAFANGFYESGSLKALDGHLLSLGGHVQYHVLDGRGGRQARWLGLDATTGLELARWTLGAGSNGPIATRFTLQGTTPGESRNLTLTSTGTLSLVATTVTVPIEVTTGVRLGNAIALYTGGGIDVTGGGSTLTVQLDGDLTITQDATNVGHVVITASGDNSAPPLSAHALAGLQLEAPHFQLVVQGLVTPSVYGANVGIRVVFD